MPRGIGFGYVVSPSSKASFKMSSVHRGSLLAPSSHLCSFFFLGNENWEFDSNCLMKKRHASINDVPIDESERLFHWPWDAPRPDDHPGLTELGL